MRPLVLKLSLVAVTMMAFITLSRGSDAVAQTILFDNYETGLRVINPSLTNNYRWLWNQCDVCETYFGGPSEPGTQSATSQLAHDGKQSLQITVLAGTVYMQFYPYVDSAKRWDYLRQWTLGSPWAFNTYNRLKFWIKVPPGIQKASGGDRNFDFGTYLRSQSAPTNSAESDNLHFYHWFNVPYTGQWHQVIVDNHPDHRRDDPAGGNDEQPVMINPTGEPGVNYFDAMTRVYVDFHLNPSSYPADFLFDGFELYNEIRPENVDQIRALNGVYVPSTNEIIVGWRRNKNDNTINHEVRYSFQDIFTIGWNAATPAPNGLVAPLGYGGYNGMEWSTRSIALGTNKTIYIAIKPQNSTLFHQIAIPLPADTAPPSAPSNLRIQ